MQTESDVCDRVHKRSFSLFANGMPNVQKYTSNIIAVSVSYFLAPNGDMAIN